MSVLSGNKVYTEVILSEFFPVVITHEQKSEQWVAKVVGMHHIHVVTPMNDDDIPSELVDELMAHEYTHLWQRRHRPLSYLASSLLLSWYFSIGCFIIAALTPNSVWFLMLFIPCVIALLPIYPVMQMEREFTAYGSGFLAEMANVWNQKALPAHATDLWRPHAWDVMQIVYDNMFSALYHNQWAPRPLRRWFYARMLRQINSLRDDYFHTRLAYEEKKSYINPRTYGAHRILLAHFVSRLPR